MSDADWEALMRQFRELAQEIANLQPKKEVMDTRRSITAAAERVASRLPAERGDLSEERAGKLIQFFIKAVRNYARNWDNSTVSVQVTNEENFWTELWVYAELETEIEANEARPLDQFARYVEAGEAPSKIQAQNNIRDALYVKKKQAITRLIEGALHV